MALQKNFEQNTGVIANYIKVDDSVKINASNESGVAKVLFYLNAAARAANKVPVTNKSYNIPAGTFSTLNLASQDARDLVYTYLKTLPEFTGALDV